MREWWRKGDKFCVVCMLAPPVLPSTLFFNDDSFAKIRSSSGEECGSETKHQSVRLSVPPLKLVSQLQHKKRWRRLYWFEGIFLGKWHRQLKTHLKIMHTINGGKGPIVKSPPDSSFKSFLWTETSNLIGLHWINHPCMRLSCPSLFTLVNPPFALPHCSKQYYGSSHHFCICDARRTLVLRQQGSFVDVHHIS